MPKRKLNKSQRRAFAKVMHFYAHSLGTAASGLAVSNGPLAEFFVDALTDEERKLMALLQKRVRKNAQLLHALARRVEGFRDETEKHV